MNLQLAVISDLNMEVGLHITLCTALKFLHPDWTATIHLFLKDFSTQRIDRLHQTLAPYHGRYELQIYDAEILDLGSGKALHGSKMPYLSLIAPNLIDADKLLLLDADLLVLTDLSELFTQDLQGKIAGVVFMHPVAKVWSKERHILRQTGLSDDAPYFSSGVVLFDAKQWKAQKLTDRCFEIIDRYSNELSNTDQTVMNAALGGDVFLMPEHYHRIFYTLGYSIDPNLSGCICHIGGSPKPWDFLGEFLNNSYPAFKTYMAETAFANYKSYLNLSPAKLKRTLLLTRSYYLAFRHHLTCALANSRQPRVANS